MRALLAQVRVELALSLRNGEQLLVNLFIPLGLLVFFSQVDVLDTGQKDPVNFLAPAVLALAVMSSSLVSLGIGTGFERSYGVLKRLGATPLGRPRWVAAKFVCTGIIEIAQWAVLIVAALRQAGGNRAQAAKILQMNRSALFKLLKRLAIEE